MSDEIAALEQEIHEKQKKLATLKRSQSREPVEDYELRGRGGSVRLSELFGDREDLIVIHNMGRSCTYCTLWADGFNGLYDHLIDRAAFIVISPDSPAEQQEFAEGRGWRFPMASGEGSTFIEDMGYRTSEYVMPGVSTFHRNEDGQIERVATAPFGPGDVFNPAWHLFDLLADGSSDWNPKFEYAG